MKILVKESSQWELIEGSSRSGNFREVLLSFIIMLHFNPFIIEIGIEFINFMVKFTTLIFVCVQCSQEEKILLLHNILSKYDENKWNSSKEHSDPFSKRFNPPRKEQKHFI